MDARVGIGFDSHRLVKNRRFVLGGVVISDEIGPVAHSDGDVLIHALIDAILGGCGLKEDIGRLFPDSDERFKDISSTVLLEDVRDKIMKDGWKVINIDSVVILEKPQIAPFKELICRNIAKLLCVSASSINIKGKTHEGMCVVGMGSVVQCFTVALLCRS